MIIRSTQSQLPPTPAVTEATHPKVLECLALADYWRAQAESLKNNKPTREVALNECWHWTNAARTIAELLASTPWPTGNTEHQC